MPGGLPNLDEPSLPESGGGRSQSSLSSLSLIGSGRLELQPGLEFRSLIQLPLIRGDVLTVGSGAPAEIRIQLQEDDLYELDEGFTLGLEVVRPAAEGETILETEEIHVRINNDDGDVPPGALVFYDFDRTVSGPNGYEYDPTATVLNPAVTATPLLHAGDTPNFGLFFDGILDRATASQGTSAFTLPSADFTVDFWVRPDSFTGRRTIASIGAGTLLFVQDGNAIKYRLATSEGVTERTIGTAAAGRWHHVALTYDEHVQVTGPGIQDRVFLETVTGYLNGTATTTVLDAGFASFTTQSLSLGDGVNTFLGTVDEFRVWTAALAANAVEDLPTQNTDGNEANLLVLYKFDAATGNLAANHTGKGWDASLGVVANGVKLFAPDFTAANDSPLAATNQYTSSSERGVGLPKISPVFPLANPSSAISSTDWVFEDTATQSQPCPTSLRLSAPTP